MCFSFVCPARALSGLCSSAADCNIRYARYCTKTNGVRLFNAATLHGSFSTTMAAHWNGPPGCGTYSSFSCLAFVLQELHNQPIASSLPSTQARFWCLCEHLRQYAFFPLLVPADPVHPTARSHHECWHPPEHRNGGAGSLHVLHSTSLSSSSSSLSAAGAPGAADAGAAKPGGGGGAGAGVLLGFLAFFFSICSARQLQSASPSTHDSSEDVSAAAAAAECPGGDAGGGSEPGGGGGAGAAPAADPRPEASRHVSHTCSGASRVFFLRAGS